MNENSDRLRPQMWFVAATLLMMTATSRAQWIKAYDCLTEPPLYEAWLKMPDYVVPTAEHGDSVKCEPVRVMAWDDEWPIRFRMCSVTERYDWADCPDDTDSGADASSGSFSVTVVLGRDGCERLHETREYTLDGGETLRDIQLNVTGSVTRTVAGVPASGGGGCRGAEFRLGDRTWRRAVVNVTHSVLLYEGYNRELQDDLRHWGVELSAGYNWSPTGEPGRPEIAWSEHEPRLLYDGPAALTDVHLPGPAGRQRHVVIRAGAVMFGTELQRHAAGDETPDAVRADKHRGLYVTRGSSAEPPSPENGTWMAQLSRYADRMYAATAGADCGAMAREFGVRLALDGARPALERPSGAGVAYPLFGGPEHAVVTDDRGGSPRLLACRPVAVRVAESLRPHYIDLPVEYKGQTFFLAPGGQTLRRRGRATGCGETPAELWPLFRTSDGYWIDLMPFSGCRNRRARPEIVDGLRAYVATWSRSPQDPRQRQIAENHGYYEEVAAIAEARQETASDDDAWCGSLARRLWQWYDEATRAIIASVGIVYGCRAIVARFSPDRPTTRH